jgi:hypothetical protein
MKIDLTSSYTEIPSSRRLSHLADGRALVQQLVDVHRAGRCAPCCECSSFRGRRAGAPQQPQFAVDNVNVAHASAAYDHRPPVVLHLWSQRPKPGPVAMCAAEGTR